jgi:chemotaxis protein methyltransferase CheR
MAFTFFFRDSQTLEVAMDHLIPNIIGQSSIHVWDAGCAHGPEPYTIAIMLRERMSEMLFRNVRIHASDIDNNFQTHVLEGIYPSQEIQRIPSEIRDKYFIKCHKEGHRQICDELRSHVRFLHHDLLSFKPIREDFSLIVCKNVLLHFSEDQRCELLKMYYRCLRSGGMLVLEHTQKLPPALGNYFQPVVSYAQIYRRLEPLHIHFTPKSFAKQSVITYA